jgi:hypothetical protein
MIGRGGPCICYLDPGAEPTGGYAESGRAFV